MKVLVLLLMHLHLHHNNAHGCDRLVGIIGLPKIRMDHSPRLLPVNCVLVQYVLELCPQISNAICLDLLLCFVHFFVTFLLAYHRPRTG